MLRALTLALLIPVLGGVQGVAPQSPRMPARPSSPAMSSGSAASRTTNCNLPAGVWHRRQALMQEFGASGGHSDSALLGLQSIDAQYRRFLVAVSEAYAAGHVETVNACCLGAKGDPEASIVCALVHYLQGGRKNPDQFLAALPQAPEAAVALDDLQQAASSDQHASSLAALPVYHVTEELYRLILAANPRATATYFWLLHHSNGAWADDAADQLERLLRNHPDAVVRDWPFLKRSWNLSEGITWDVDANWWQGTIANFQRICRPEDPRCDEILNLLRHAARAAGPDG